jgi:hypothetical protein
MRLLSILSAFFLRSVGGIVARRLVEAPEEKKEHGGGGEEEPCVIGAHALNP